ncbi:MAG: HD domain-containing protein [Clostridiales bacterium]|jgi:HD-GYP domain-containing protein (c-di-GMP phosphodiesterase class II)|nr:HD domain-containing protein [Clostridiales bacterium]
MDEYIAKEHKPDEPKMPEYAYDFKKVFDVVLAFNSETRYEKLLDIILTKMMEITRSDGGTLYIVEDEKLHYRIVKNISLGIFQSDGEISMPPIVLDDENIKNVRAYAALKNEIVMIDDVYASKEFNFNGTKKFDEDMGYTTKSMMFLPLCASRSENQEVLGVIQLINAMDAKTGEVVPYGDTFAPPVATALANLAAGTLVNLMHMHDIKMLFYSFVGVMTQAIDERSRYASTHTQTVAKLCKDFAQYLQANFPKDHPYYFDENRIERLTVAALLHDIGKIVTPVNIMDKATRLGESMFTLRNRFEIKRHQLEIDFLKGVLTQKSYNNEIKRLNDALVLVEAVNPAGFLPEEIFERVEKLEDFTYRNSLGQVVPLLDEYDMEALLIRRGTLTRRERLLMEDHAVVTGRLLDKMAFWKYYKQYKDVPELARNHHEFLNGTGYPRRLTAEDIHLDTCIMTITDIFEALLAEDRPYKRSVPVDKALSILWEMAEEGKLHKELVRLFSESRVWEIGYEEI